MFGVKAFRQLIEYNGWSYEQTWSIYRVPRHFLYYPVNLLLERIFFVWTKILFTGLTIAWFAQRQCLPIQCLVRCRNLTEIWIIICETDGYSLVLLKRQLLQNQMKYSAWWMVEIIFHHVPRLLSNYEWLKTYFEMKDFKKKIKLCQFDWIKVHYERSFLWLRELFGQINPLTPMSDQDRISPYNINTILTR